MTWLERIAACNVHDLSRHRPWFVGGRRVGWIREDRLPRLEGHPLRVEADGVVLDEALATPAERTAALVPLLRELADDGEITRWRGEGYGVQPDGPGGEILLDLERAAAPWFGIRAFGVHLNGYVRRGDELAVWIGERSADRPTYPGELDNTVAGGLPSGMAPRECAIKECGEEAGIPEALAARAVSTGTIAYLMETSLGIKADTVYTFDLELPVDFLPRPADGEMAGYRLVPVDELAALVRDTERFKFNCALVCVDFLVRHGILGPEDPDHRRVCAGLHADLDALEDAAAVGRARGNRS